MNYSLPGRYSQTSLEQYLLCQRRFWLRYVRGLAWPPPVGAQALQIEEALERGQQFHEWVAQQSLGFDLGTMVNRGKDEVLKTWNHNYVRSPYYQQENEYVYSEIELSTRINGCVLMARIDRLIVQPGKSIDIIDWKTGYNNPDANRKRNSFQTKVYRYVVLKSVHQLPIMDLLRVDAEQIHLTYWYPEYPETPIHIGYSEGEHEQIEAYLSSIIQEILQKKDVADYPVTPDTTQCVYCPYQRYCDRVTEPAQDEYWPDEDLLIEMRYHQELTESLEQHAGGSEHPYLY